MDRIGMYYCRKNWRKGLGMRFERSIYMYVKYSLVVPRTRSLTLTLFAWLWLGVRLYYANTMATRHCLLPEFAEFALIITWQQRNRIMDSGICCWIVHMLVVMWWLHHPLSALTPNDLSSFALCKAKSVSTYLHCTPSVVHVCQQCIVRGWG